MMKTDSLPAHSAAPDLRNRLRVYKELNPTGNFRVRYRPTRLETETEIAVADGYGNIVSRYLTWRPHRDTDSNRK